VIAWLIRMITGAHARWVGISPTDAQGNICQRIYFANHQSNLDAPVVWASLPAAVRKRTRPVAARDYWQAGPLRRLLARHVFRAVLIERRKVTPSCNPLSDLGAALEAGDSLIIFPEGTRAGEEPDDDPGEFKPGLWHLARKHANVQLVPVYLENLNRILPKGDFLLVPLLAAVTFGEPIRFDENEPKPQFLKRARDAVMKLEQRQ
jgi:1-acyl-sn-glycerol-3-phosphate acyltransferase